MPRYADFFWLQKRWTIHLFSSTSFVPGFPAPLGGGGGDNRAVNLIIIRIYHMKKKFEYEQCMNMNISYINMNNVSVDQFSHSN